MILGGRSWIIRGRGLNSCLLYGFPVLWSVGIVLFFSFSCSFLLFLHVGELLTSSLLEFLVCLLFSLFLLCLLVFVAVAFRV